MKGDAGTIVTVEGPTSPDTDRIGWVADLVSEGYGDRLVLSHDIYLTTFLATYGGSGTIVSSSTPTCSSVETTSRRT